MLLNIQLLIFEEFLRDFDSSLTGSFIAKKKNLNQKTVSNYLNKLESENILVSKTQGKNKLYSLNFQNKELVLNFVFAIEHLRTIDFFKSNILVKEISGKIKPFIDGVAVIFGSYVKGSQKQTSDLDLFIIGSCNEKKIDEISKLYNLDISIKLYPELEFDILTKEVIKNHIIIKNAELFIEGLLK